MMLHGITDYTVYRDDDEIEVYVDWTCERCSYGDGSDDVEFCTVAKRLDTNEVIELTEKEEQRLFEFLEMDGEI